MLYLVSIAIAWLMLLYLVWRVKYRYPPEGSSQVLCYHKITSRFCFEGTWTTPDRFFRQIDFLLERGFAFIGEEAFLETLGRSAPGPGESKKLLLTFDDGYSGILELIMPGVESRKIPLLVFLVAGYAGRENSWDLSMGRRPFRHLSWDETRDLVSRGVMFGSHGMTHADLTAIPENERRREIHASKQRIEEEVGIRVQSFSFPFGRYNADVKSMIGEAGYKTAFSLYPSHHNAVVDRYALRRNGVYIIDTPRSVLWKLERGPMFWFEEMKCRTINRVAVLTPVLKNFYSRRDS